MKKQTKLTLNDCNIFDKFRFVNNGAVYAVSGITEFTDEATGEIVCLCEITKMSNFSIEHKPFDTPIKYII